MMIQTHPTSRQLRLVEDTISEESLAMHTIGSMLLHIPDGALMANDNKPESISCTINAHHNK